MGVLTSDYYWCSLSYNFLSSKTHFRNPCCLSSQPSALNCGADILNNFISIPSCEWSAFVTKVSRKQPCVSVIGGYGGSIVAFATRKSGKKLKRNKGKQNDVVLETSEGQFSDYNDVVIKDTNGDKFTSVMERNLIAIPSRNAVLQACSVTSGLMALLGLVIRKVSEVASSGGLPVFDCSVVSFDFEIWHLELIAGLVVSISLSRYILLKIWPDFAESSEAANRQVLTSLVTLDYVVVALLSGLSEELLFRGGLLPLVGLNWKGALVVALLFGVLHLGSGRKSSFAVWATFVGMAYGYGTIVSSSMFVPMASHTMNNLIGALLWRFTSTSAPERMS